MDSRERAIAAYALAGGEVFKEAIARAETTMTAYVMDMGTTPDDRALALAEYHALQRIRSYIQLWAQDGKSALENRAD